jgi:CheY-like chemotaxis protein
MEILVADLDFSSRVPLEKYLREQNHRIINLENGLEIAKLAAGGRAPRIAFLANNIEKLRGVDVCRFLSALEKKQLLYVILMVEKADTQMLARYRLAGVDDVLVKPLELISLATSLELAERIVCLEDELRVVRDTLGKSLSSPGILGERMARLKVNNIALLKGKGEAATKPPAPAGPKAQPADKVKPVKASNAFRPTQPKQVAFAKKPESPSEKSSVNFLFNPASTPEKPSRETPEERQLAAEEAVPTSFTPPAADPFADPFGISTTPPSVEKAYEEVQSFAAAEQEEELEDVLIHPFEFDELVLNVFSGMEVVLKPEIPPMTIPSGEGGFVSFVGLVLPESKLWVDVVLVASDSAARAVTKAILGEDSPADEDVLEMIAELMNMLQGSLKLQMEEKSMNLVQASIPKCRREPKLPELGEDGLEVDSGFSIEGFPVNLFLYRTRSLRTCDQVGDLQPFECVLENIPSPNADAQEPLLKAGSVLKDNILQVLRNQLKELAPVELITPSERARKLDLML